MAAMVRVPRRLHGARRRLCSAAWRRFPAEADDESPATPAGGVMESLSPRSPTSGRSPSCSSAESAAGRRARRCQGQGVQTTLHPKTGHASVCCARRPCARGPYESFVHGAHDNGWIVEDLKIAACDQFCDLTCDPPTSIPVL